MAASTSNTSSVMGFFRGLIHTSQGPSADVEDCSLGTGASAAQAQVISAETLKADAVAQIIIHQLSYRVSCEHRAPTADSVDKGTTTIQRLTLFSWYGIYDKRGSLVKRALESLGSVIGTTVHNTDAADKYHLISSEYQAATVANADPYADAVIAYVFGWAKEREQISPLESDFKGIPGLSEAEEQWQREALTTGQLGPFANPRIGPAYPKKQLTIELKEVIPYCTSVLRIALAFSRTLGERVGSTPVNLGRVYASMRVDETLPQIDLNQGVGLVGYHSLLTPWGVIPFDLGSPAEVDMSDFVVISDGRLEGVVRERFAPGAPIMHEEEEIRSLGRDVEGKELPPIVFKAAAGGRLSQEQVNFNWESIRDHVFARICRLP